jgi:transposase
MNQITLFQKALDIIDTPWEISEVSLDVENLRLNIRIKHSANDSFACPVCDRKGCYQQGYTNRTWRHLAFFQFATNINAQLPQIVCPECGANQIKVPWSGKGKSITHLYEMSMRA